MKSLKNTHVDQRGRKNEETLNTKGCSTAIDHNTFLLKHYTMCFTTTNRDCLSCIINHLVYVALLDTSLTCTGTQSIEGASHAITSLSHILVSKHWVHAKLMCPGDHFRNAILRFKFLSRSNY